MKRMLLTLLMALVCALSRRCGAAAADLQSEQSAAYGADAVEQSLPEAAYETFGALTLKDAASPEAQLEKLWTKLTGASQDILFSAARNAALLLIVVFLSSFCGTISGGSACSGVARTASAIAVSVLSAEHVTSCVAVGREALWALSDFSRVLLPSLCTAAAAGGAITSAGAKYAATTLFFDLLITVETDLLLPALYAYAAMMIAGNALQNELLLSISSLLKAVIKWFLLAVATIFTAYLAITGILTSTADAAAAKAAKTAISAALPVVGSILSDAAATLVSGAAVIRNGIGVLGMLGVLAVCGIPFLTLGVHYLLYQLTGGIAAAFCEKQLANLIQGFADVYAFLLGMTGAASFILFLSIVSSMKAVSVG